MKKKVVAVLMSVLLLMGMLMPCAKEVSVLAASDGYVVNQNFDTMPTVSSTKGDTTNGAWSTEVSSSMGNHITYSHYVSSSGSTSLKLKVTDGRYTIGAYCGFQGATSQSKLSFKVWIPEGSTITRIDKITIGSTQILGQTALTAGAWNKIETSTFGSKTSGAVYMQFYSSSAAASQSFYIDNFQISGGSNTSTPVATATPKPTATPTPAPSTSGYAVYEQFENGVPTSTTVQDTENGVWSSAYSSSLAVDHVSFAHSSSGYNGTKAMKLNVGNGRYTIDFYMGFEDANEDDTLTFKTYVPSGSTVTAIKKIEVNGTQIMGETTLTQGKWVEINAGELGDTDGVITFEYYSSSACADQYFYIDDVIIGGGSGSSSSSGSGSSGGSATTSTVINMGYLPYYRTDCVEDLDFDALTHLCLAFFNPDTSSLEITHKFDSDSEVADITDQAHDNDVLVLASYGGASGKTIYTEILPSSSKRATLVENMVDHAVDNGFDGIDIDIEASSKYTDIWNYYDSFISALRERCDEEGLLLTTATAKWIAEGTSSTALKQFDLVGVMAYDNSGENHSTYEDAIAAVEYFEGRGIDKSKIVMGVPFYGYIAGSDLEGSTSYKAICEADSSAYKKDSSNGITYNGIPTIQKKCQYVMDNGYAGVLIWELGQDSPVEKYSLLNAMKLTLYGEDGVR